MGGYGWAFQVGKSLPARLIEFVKKRGEHLPIMSYGYLASIFENNRHEVEFVKNRIPDADLVIIQPTMVDYREELDWVTWISTLPSCFTRFWSEGLNRVVLHWDAHQSQDLHLKGVQTRHRM